VAPAGRQPEKSSAKPTAALGPFVPLFNGKDLSGWTATPGNQGDWSVRGAVIAGVGTELASGISTTRADFTDFHLRMKVRRPNGLNARFVLRLGDEGWRYVFDSGGTVVRHAPILAGDYWITQGHPRPVSKDRLDGLIRSDDRFNDPRWHVYEFIARGNALRMRIDGRAVSAFEDRQSRLSRGAIGFRLLKEGRVEIQDIEIREIPPDAPSDVSALFTAGPAGPTETLLAAAKTRFADTNRAADQELIAQFDRQVELLEQEQAKPESRANLIEAVKREQDRFRKQRLFPWSAPMRSPLRTYMAARGAAEADLRRALQHAVEQATRDHNDSAAAGLLAELTSLLTPHRVGAFRGVGTNFQRVWTYELYSDGTVQANVASTKVWWLEGDTLIIQFPDPARPQELMVDRCRLSADGQTLDAVNNHKGRYTGRFVDLEK
jgi:hypothetical protein